MANPEAQNRRVLVADERQKYLDQISEAVEDLGHEVIAHETDIATVGRSTQTSRPDLAIVALHDDTEHALDLIDCIIEEATCPVLVLADDASPDFVAEAARRGVFAYLDSTDATELQGGIDVALQRYEQYRDLLAAFERRAQIERAKGVLMERHGLSDQDAFERIRTSARNERRPLMEIVGEVVSSEGYEDRQTGT